MSKGPKVSGRDGSCPDRDEGGTTRRRGGAMGLLEELCSATAIAGREQAVIDILKRELAGVTDSVSVVK